MSKTEYIAHLQGAMREILDLVMGDFPEELSDMDVQELNEEVTLCLLEHTGDARRA